MAQSSCVLTIFSSLCLNGNSAVGIVSSTSILDIKTAMTKKKMVLQNSEDFFSISCNLELLWMAYVLEFFCFSKLCVFFSWLWSRQRRLLETWILLFLKSQHGIRNLAHVYRTSLSDLHHFRYPSFTRSPPWNKLDDVAECICGHLGALRLHSNIKENPNLWDLCLNPGMMACFPAGWQDRSRSETDWHLKPGCLEDGWKSSPRHRDCTWTLCSSAPTFFCRSTRYGSWL